MPTILISGAANGLGEAFVQSYRELPGFRIIAIDKSRIAATHENVVTFEVDIANEQSVHRFEQQLQNEPIDLVIHSAGIRGLVPAAESKWPDDVQSCETVDVMDPATLSRAFHINACGTFILLRALLPNLSLSGNPKVIVMSSRMGSIGNNELPNKDAGSAYAYRASKAAMNAIVRSFTVDFPNVVFILCHPGRVETKLVRCKELGAITAEESVRSILPLIDTWSKADSGRFYDRFGHTIQW